MGERERSAAVANTRLVLEAQDRQWTDTRCSYNTSPAVFLTSTRQFSPRFTVCRLNVR